jgi:hypothetical protein
LLGKEIVALAASTFVVAFTGVGLGREQARNLWLAQSGALRARLVDGKRPPTSEATNRVSTS